jgi:hypothetical protein
MSVESVAFGVEHGLIVGVWQSTIEDHLNRLPYCAKSGKVVQRHRL